MEFEDYLDLNNSDSFALRVQDDGMIEAGILNNDLVLVCKQPVSQAGEIVIAIVEKNKSILRYLRKTGGHYYLDPANSKYHSILVGEDTALIGKVVSVIRQFT